MKTDTELLEYLMLELESTRDSLDEDDIASTYHKLDYLVTEIYDHLGSKAIQTDYVMKGNL